MPKKSDSRHENRGRSSMERGGHQKADREQRADRQNEPRQQDQIRQDGPVVSPGDFRQQRQEERSGDQGGYRNLLRGNRKMFQGKGLGEDNKKDGCLPKLFMLVLPFVAVLTYVFFGS